jgi:hypothetical protein
MPPRDLGPDVVNAGGDVLSQSNPPRSTITLGAARALPASRLPRSVWVYTATGCRAARSTTCANNVLVKPNSLSYQL